LLLSHFKSLFIFTVAAGLSFGLAAASNAEDRSHRAEKLVNDLSLNAKDILSRKEKSLEERESHLIQSIGDNFHLVFIGEFVVGPDWGKMSEMQQEEFIELFQDFYLRAYSSQLGGYPEDELVIISTLKKGSKDSFVITELNRPKRQTVSIHWRIREFEDKPQIIDILIDGTSVAFSHREGFSKVLKNDGIEGLIDLLKIRAERLSAQPAG